MANQGGAAPQQANRIGKPRLPVFSGEVDDGPVEKFSAEADRVLANYAIAGNVAVEFVLQFLEGEARSEILDLPAAQRDTATKILNHLKAAFADQRPVSALQAAFHSRVQLGGETLMQFSSSLKQLDTAIAAKIPGGQGPGAAGVRDRFAEGVADPNLRRCLSDFIEANPNSNLVEVRQKAMRWTRQGESEVTAAQQQQQAVDGKGDSKADSALEAITTMTAAMTKMMEALSMRTGWRRRTVNSNCYKCDKPGHFRRNCPEN